ncbi:hypothetical protein DW107_12505 [Tannerella sp. AM09-19]|nr:hypothetical protein DW107_12505 [Tannerella sp. AM09-19]
MSAFLCSSIHLYHIISTFCVDILYDFVDQFKGLSQFSDKKYYQVIFAFSFGLFPRQIARYPPHKNRKTSS